MSTTESTSEHVYPFVIMLKRLQFQPIKFRIIFTDNYYDTETQTEVWLLIIHQEIYS